MTAGTRCDGLPDVFTHEMCSYPPAPFESKHVMLEANKSVLADALWPTDFKGDGKPGPGTRTYVLGGGALLHKIPWTKGNNWHEIIDDYVRYVTKKYEEPYDIRVVFDGYDGKPSTKDGTHMRRNRGCVGSVVYFDETMKLQTKRKNFWQTQKISKDS